MVWLIIKEFWLAIVLLMALAVLIGLLIRVTLFGSDDFQCRTYDANNPKDRKKLHEIIQGGPDERYIDHGFL